MAHVFFPGNIPEIGFHHWAAGAALTTSIAHKGGCAGTMALASSVLDLLTGPDLVEAAKETFSHEIGNIRYQSLLPKNLKPSIDLNRAEMEKFRPLMEPHYRLEIPAFA
jgi:aminobenzoyl-glutamate utilization protein B